MGFGQSLFHQFVESLCFAILSFVEGKIVLKSKKKGGKNVDGFTVWSGPQILYIWQFFFLCRVSTVHCKCYVGLSKCSQSVVVFRLRILPRSCQDPQRSCMISQDLAGSGKILARSGNILQETHNISIKPNLGKSWQDLSKISQDLFKVLVGFS